MKGRMFKADGRQHGWVTVSRRGLEREDGGEETEGSDDATSPPDLRSETAVSEFQHVLVVGVSHGPVSVLESPPPRHIM